MRKQVGLIAVLAAIVCVVASCGTSSGASLKHDVVPPGPRARVVFSIPTKDPVVFVTIDDGFVQDPRVLAFLRQNHWPVSMFLIGRVVKAHPKFFRELMATGATVDDHTETHPHLPKLRYEEQRKQICQPNVEFPRELGVHPVLFRPPYGNFDDATLRAAEACGYTTVLRWSAKSSNGSLTIVGGGNRPLRAGDILLLHFRKYLIGDLEYTKIRLARAHLHVGRLEDYIGASGGALAVAHA